MYNRFGCLLDRAAQSRGCDRIFVTFSASMATRRDEISVSRAEYLSRSSAISFSSHFRSTISRLSCTLLQERHMNGSSVFESSLYRHGGILARPLWNQRPQSPSHSSASSFMSTIVPWQTPQGTLPRRGGLFRIGPVTMDDHENTLEE